MNDMNYTEVSEYDRCDILVPYEYWKAHRADRFRQPGIRLMSAVLEDALHCYFMNVQMRSRREKRIFAETEEWFFSTESDGLFTFENICSLLGIDPDCVRRGLKLFKRAYRTRDQSGTAIAA